VVESVRPAQRATIKISAWRCVVEFKPFQMLVSGMLKGKQTQFDSAWLVQIRMCWLTEFYHT